MGKKKDVRSAIEGFLRGLKPIKRLTVSQWADLYRYLSEMASAEPGRWDTSRVPYLRQIMDDLSSTSPIQESVVMKGAQLGFTEAGLNWLGYLIDNDPCPAMAVMPTDSTMRRNSKTRIDPMIQSTPRLRDKIMSAGKKDTQTMFEKNFEGGILLMCGANSPSNLASQPVRALFLDEIDRYPIDLGGEGNPIGLAEARTRTFARRKIFKISTPTLQGESAIEAEYETTDQRKYHVPCPHCGGMQSLVFDQLRYEIDKKTKRPTSAVYECEHCHEKIEERYKTQMFAAGEWIATRPENANPTRVGYHINSLYSPLGWFSWLDVVSQYEAAKKDPGAMKVFVNTVLGLPFAESGEVPSWEILYNRRETYAFNRPPKDVCILTAGADVQADRIEVQIVGWGRGRRSWSLDHRTLIGNTGETSVWDQLAKIVNEVWTREDGVQMPLAMMAVDTGYNTNHVYNFCRRFDPTRVIAIKGSDNQTLVASAPKAVDYKQDGGKVLSVMLWMLGVSVLKSELYAWLRLNKDEFGESPEGYCHFPQYPAEFFKGITAEQLEAVISRGHTRYQWVKKYRRNEPLDTWIYARACASIQGIDRYDEQNWLAAEAANALIITRNSGETAAPKKKTRTDFW